MSKVISKDGTTIAYEKRGSGPAVILVDGALGFRSFSASSTLADLLSPFFTVYIYDRRGRGESGDSKPFALEREVEDIEALIDEAGGQAYVYGISSGACLALEAAIRLDTKIKKLALYEPPYNSDAADVQPWKAYRETIAKELAEGHRGDAVAAFMRFVGVPAEMITGMRQSPQWPTFEGIAPTLIYDAEAIGKDRCPPLDRAAQVSASTLVMDGGANLEMMPFMHATASQLSKVIPHVQWRTLEGQTHDVKTEVLAPVLIDFIKS